MVRIDPWTVYHPAQCSPRTVKMGTETCCDTTPGEEGSPSPPFILSSFPGLFCRAGRHGRRNPLYRRWPFSDIGSPPRRGKTAPRTIISRSEKDHGQTSQTHLEIPANHQPRDPRVAAPARAVFGTRLGSLLFILLIPALVVSGILTVEWKDGRPRFKFDRERAREVPKRFLRKSGTGPSCRCRSLPKRNPYSGTGRRPPCFRCPNKCRSQNPISH